MTIDSFIWIIFKCCGQGGTYLLHLYVLFDSVFITVHYLLSCDVLSGENAALNSSVKHKTK